MIINYDRRESRNANIVLAIGGLNGFVSTEVQNLIPIVIGILRVSYSAKNPVPSPIHGTLPPMLKDNDSE